MQRAFVFVLHECSTARACVAGVRLLNVLSEASWFRVGGREPEGEQECSSFWLSRGLRCARTWAFGVVVGARDEPDFDMIPRELTGTAALWRGRIGVQLGMVSLTRRGSSPNLG